MRSREKVREEDEYYCGKKMQRIFKMARLLSSN